MKLMTVAVLRSRLGVMDLADINTLLSSALETTTHSLAPLLGTQFDRVEDHTEYFLLDPYNPTTSKEIPKLLLSRGLLDTAVAPTFRQAHSFQALLETTVEEDPDLYRVEYERGLVHRLQYLSSSVYVAVTYTGGLKPRIIPNADVYADVPPWLENLAVIYAGYVFEKLKDAKAPDKKKNTIQIPNELAPGLQHYRRWVPEGHRPLV